MCTGGGVYNRQCAKKQTNLAEKNCIQCFSFQMVVSETGKTGAGGECPQYRPTCGARLRSRTTASSGMRHIASSCTSYTHVYLATRGCQCSLGMSKQFIECTPPPPPHVPFLFPRFGRSNKKIYRRRRQSGWSGLGRTTFQQVVGHTLDVKMYLHSLLRKASCLPQRFGSRDIYSISISLMWCPRIGM